MFIKDLNGMYAVMKQRNRENVSEITSADRRPRREQ